MRLLRIAVPVRHQAHVVQMRGDTGVGAVHDGADLGDDIRPDIVEAGGQRGRVAPPQDGRVAIVVEHHPLRPPGDEHGLRGPHHDLRQHAQRLGPMFHRAEQRGGPVQRRGPRAHPATLPEQAVA
jgi:hypothetical protein